MAKVTNKEVVPTASTYRFREQSGKMRFFNWYKEPSRGVGGYGSKIYGTLKLSTDFSVIQIRFALFEPHGTLVVENLKMDINDGCDFRIDTVILTIEELWQEAALRYEEKKVANEVLRKLRGH